MLARILFVDDDAVSRYAVSEILRLAGFEVIEAEGYSDTLKLLEDGTPYDLLVMDISIPRVNGFALARMVRMKQHGLKTIYVTAYDLKLDEAAGPVLRKPVPDELLLETIKTTLGWLPA